MTKKSAAKSWTVDARNDGRTGYVLVTPPSPVIDKCLRAMAKHMCGLVIFSGLMLARKQSAQSFEIGFPSAKSAAIFSKTVSGTVTRLRAA